MRLAAPLAVAWDPLALGRAPSHTRLGVESVTLLTQHPPPGTDGGSAGRVPEAMSWRVRLDRWRQAGAESTRPEPESDAPEAGEGHGEGRAGPVQRISVDRFAVWREILGTWWIALSAAFAAIGAAAFQLGWKIQVVGRGVDERWALLVLVLVTLVVGVFEGSHRAVARRERVVEERRQEIERLIRTPQRRLAQAKYHLYRDAFMCAQLVGFLMMTRMEASAMTPEAALGIERSWGEGFLERFRRMFGTGRFGEVFSHRIPPPREQAIAVYAGLADFLRLLAERITERDLDPAYLHGRDEEPGPTSGACADAHPGDPARPADAAAGAPGAAGTDSPEPALERDGGTGPNAGCASQ